MSVATAVYILCAVTSVLCAGLLVRSYLRSRVRLLLWSALCFVGLAVNNVLLFRQEGRPRHRPAGPARRLGPGRRDAAAVRADLGVALMLVLVLLVRDASASGSLL